MERDNAERDARQNETKVCVSSCPFSDQTFISLYNTKKFSGGQVSRTIELISKLESSANVSFLRPPNQRDLESVCLSGCLTNALLCFLYRCNELYHNHVWQVCHGFTNYFLNHSCAVICLGYLSHARIGGASREAWRNWKSPQGCTEWTRSHDGKQRWLRQKRARVGEG